MEIKPIKKIKRVKQSNITSDDLLSRPSLKNTPIESRKIPIEFVKRQLLYQGKDIAQVIKETSINNPALLSKIAQELEKFKEDSLKKRKRRFFKKKKDVDRTYSEEELATIFAVCDAYIARISELIKKRYDETKDGMSVHFDEDGQMILNGMNVHVLIKQCQEHPSDKSKMFLKGIRSRLERVLINKIDSRNYDRLKEVITDIFEEIDKILSID